MRTWSEFASVLHPTDNVAVAKMAVPAGTELLFDTLRVTIRTAIPPGHKLALRPVPLGGSVIKYGQFIGQASQAIQPGDFVHTHNLIAGSHFIAHDSRDFSQMFFVNNDA